jgi:N6-adenosine-specific RNA methylase IME4
VTSLVEAAQRARAEEIAPLPTTPGGWRCIIADPPWRFSDRNTRGAAERHYSTMDDADVGALPVESVCAPDALLALWVPDTHLVLALAVAQGWGFTYRHLVVWGKVGATGKIQIGLGHRFRKAHEVALICSRGSPKILDHGVPSLFLAPRTRHSAKPPNLHAALERLVAGPRLELFARSPRAGWTLWGNQAPQEAA